MVEQIDRILAALYSVIWVSVTSVSDACAVAPKRDCLSDRNLLLAGGFIGGTGNGEEGVCGGERGRRSMKF